MSSISASPRSGAARLGDRKAPRAAGSIDPRLVWIAAGLVVAGVLAFVFLRSADEAGKQIADTQEQTVSQIDRAYDAAAQGTMGRAIVVALSLHAESGSFTTDLATLSAYDPGLHFTSGPAEGADDDLVRGGRNGVRRGGPIGVGHVLVGQDRREQRHHLRERHALHGECRHGGLGRILVATRIDPQPQAGIGR